MSDLSAARSAYQKGQDKKQDVLPAYPALMGKGDGTVLVPNRPNYVYYRTAQSNVIGEVFNNRCPSVDDLPIYVGYDQVQPRLFQVLRTRQEAYADARSTDVWPEIPFHHGLHEYGGGDDVYVEWRRIMGFRVGRPSGFTVTVDPGIILRSGLRSYKFAQTLDLSAYQPVIGTQALYVLIALNSSGVAYATVGAAQASIYALFIEHCPVEPTSDWGLAAVRLYVGQTAIGDTPDFPDIVDLRFPQSFQTGGSTILDDIKTVGDANSDYTTVQSAINAGGYTPQTKAILITPGEYAENVTWAGDGSSELYLSTLSWYASHIGPVAGVPLTLSGDNAMLDGITCVAAGNTTAIAITPAAANAFYLRGCVAQTGVNGYALDTSGAHGSTTVEARECNFYGDVRGATLLISLFDPYISSDLVVSAGTTRLIGGRVVGNATIAGGATLRCINLPNIEGTVTGTFVGAYQDYTGNIIMAAGATVDGKDVSALPDGSGTASYVTYWSDADTITGSAEMVFNHTTVGLGGNLTLYSTHNNVVQSLVIGQQDLAHGMTTVAPTDVAMMMYPGAASAGGMFFIGVTQGNVTSISFAGAVGVSVALNWPVIRFAAEKKSGVDPTMATFIGNDDIHSRFANYTTTIIDIFGDGDIETIGQIRATTTGSGAGIVLGGDAQWYRSGANIMRTPDAMTADGLVTASAGVTVPSGQYYKAQTDGNTGGYQAGSGDDVLWYRGGANLWQTPDSVTIDEGLNVGSSSGATTGQIRASGRLLPGGSTDYGYTIQSTTLDDDALVQISGAAATISLVMVECTNEATFAIYTLQGGLHSTQEVADPSNVYAFTDTDTFSCIYWDGAKYVLKNRRGGSRSYRIFLLGSA